MNAQTTTIDELDRDWACADCALIWPFADPPEDLPCDHCGGVLVDPRLILIGLAA